MVAAKHVVISKVRFVIHKTNAGESSNELFKCQ